MFWLIFAVVLNIFVGIHGQLDGSMSRQARPLSSHFDEITIEGNFNVFLTQISGMPTTGQNQAQLPLEVEATAEVHPHIIVDIIDGHILSIRIQGVTHVQQPSRLFIRYMGPLRRYSVSGSGHTITDSNGINNPPNEKLIFQQQGASSSNLLMNIYALEADIQGTGHTQFVGQVMEQATYQVQGTREVDASKLMCKRAIVDVQGTSTMTMTAIEDVAIVAGGVSKVFYQLPPMRQPSRSSSTGQATITRLT